MLSSYAHAILCPVLTEPIALPTGYRRPEPRPPYAHALSQRPRRAFPLPSLPRPDSHWHVRSSLKESFGVVVRC
eukprot:8035-Rhodomonas_salina.1